MVFTAQKVFTGLNDLFAHGVNAFEAAGGLTCLHVRAEEAAGIMEEVVVSSTVSNIYVIFSTYLSCMLQQPLRNAVSKAKNDWENAKLAVVSAKSKLDEFVRGSTSQASAASTIPSGNRQNMNHPTNYTTYGNGSSGRSSSTSSNVPPNEA